MGIKVIVAPTAEPVTQLECERHLRRDGAYDSPPATQPDADAIAGFLTTAREDAEGYTGLCIAPRTVELALDRFPCHEIELAYGPVQSILSVIYVDADGAEQVIDPVNYVTDNYWAEGSDYPTKTWLFPAVDYTWPATKAVINAVKVRYLAGFSIPGDSPQTLPMSKSIRAALLVGVDWLDKNRGGGAEVPPGLMWILQKHRQYVGLA